MAAGLALYALVQASMGVSLGMVLVVSRDGVVAGKAPGVPMGGTGRPLCWALVESSRLAGLVWPLWGGRLAGQRTLRAWQAALSSASSAPVLCVASGLSSVRWSAAVETGGLSERHGCMGVLGCL